MKALIRKRSKGRVIGERKGWTSPRTLPALFSEGPSMISRRSLCPGRIYAAGAMKVPIPRPRVAIVGSREATLQGIEDADLIARILVDKRVTIISGLAKGIDAAAHRAAIRAGGQTIAVLGTPLDRAYPRQNAELQEEIIRRFLAVSQFEVSSIVRRSNFVIRNRTMALIADASVVVQAGESSGTLSQAWEALRLGRPLYIWKPIFETSLKWPKEMVKFGAIKLSDPKDVLQNLPSAENMLKIRL